MRIGYEEIQPYKILKYKHGLLNKCQLGTKRLTYNIGDHDSWYIMSNNGKYKAATAHHHTELRNRANRRN